MQNGDARVWPAATVRVGQDAMVGRVLAMVGDGSVQRKLIRAADHLIPSEDFPGMWECMSSTGRQIGLVDDAAVHANTDLLVELARRKADAALAAEDDRDAYYTPGQVLAMLVVAVLLGAAAVFFGRG